MNYEDNDSYEDMESFEKIHRHNKETFKKRDLSRVKKATRHLKRSVQSGRKKRKTKS